MGFMENLTLLQMEEGAGWIEISVQEVGTYRRRGGSRPASSGRLSQAQQEELTGLLAGIEESAVYPAPEEGSTSVVRLVLMRTPPVEIEWYGEPPAEMEALPALYQLLTALD